MEEQLMSGEKHIECAKSDCTEKATHHVVAHIWPYGADVKAVKPIKIVIGVMLCERHAKHTKRFPLETVINNTFWELLDLRVHAQNGMPINRETLEIRLVKGSPAQHGMN